MSINKVLGMVFLVLALAGAPALAAKVDVNKADAETLMSNLNGIGPVKAKAIIDYRKKNGSFKNLSDLMQVPGIGEGIIDKNRANLSLKGGLSKSTAKKPAAVKKAASAKAKSKSAAKAAPVSKKAKAADAKKAKASKSVKSKVDPKKAKADKAKAAKAKKAKAVKAAKAKKKAAAKKAKEKKATK